jgi:hypothetical protein
MLIVANTHRGTPFVLVDLELAFVGTLWAYRKTGPKSVRYRRTWRTVAFAGEGRIEQSGEGDGEGGIGGALGVSAIEKRVEAKFLRLKDGCVVEVSTMEVEEAFQPDE